MTMGESFGEKRKEMVKSQIRNRGISDPEVLKAFREIPRHTFVPAEKRDRAYGDHPLRIGSGQTISQPYIVALMVSLLDLEKTDKVLEIGTGSGYQTAILAYIADEVFTIERKTDLLKKAKKTLEKLNLADIYFKSGDGTTGWGKHKPYDKIIGSGSVPRIPPSLTEQLDDPGKLVIPAGNKTTQHLKVVKKAGGETTINREIACNFVPLVGKEGWGEG